MERIGRYEIIAELGRGAMGIVYKARDTKIGREVAIKTIRLIDQAAPSETNALRERLFREAQSAGRLSHPGIVTIYDVAEEGGLAYITMEFVEGRTLEEMMQSGEAGEIEFIIDFLRQTAAALDYAHSKDIVHRDVKPANMMITGDGRIKITDFGIARIASSQLTQTGTVMGTPSYMSPEQIRGESVDGRSDQFSLAVIAYELLTRQKPFTGDSLTSVIFKIASGDPLPPRQWNPEIPEELEKAIMKGLAKSPEDRYPTCEELAEAIAEPGKGFQQAKPAATPERTESSAAEADLTAPAVTVSPQPEAGDSRTFGETMPLSAPRPAKLPPLRTKADARKLAIEDVEAPETPPPRKRKRRRAWAWAALFFSLLASAGAGAWILWPGEAEIDESVLAEKFEPPPPPDVFAEQVERLQQGEPPPPEPVPVNFTSQQPGVQVVVDGNQDASCVTPCSLELMPGEHQVVASLLHYRDETRTLEVGTESLAVSFDLQPLPPTPVRFASRQPGTRVVVDDDPNLSCTTPCSLELRRGEHEAKASATHYYPDTKSFSAAGDPLNVSFDLRPLPPTEVKFTSAPPGARIVVDGRPQWACSTPCALTLPRGAHEYLASQSGFRRLRKPFEVGGDPVEVHFEMEEVIGTILISSEPSGADVYVDGRKLERTTNTTARLSPGYHLIRVQKSGAGFVEQSVKVAENEFRRMRFVLAPNPPKARLVLKSSPPGANVVLNDHQQAGRTPQELELPPGSYRVTFSLDGHRPAVREVELDPDQPATLEVSLSKRN